MDGEQLFELPEDPRRSHPSGRDAGSANGNGTSSPGGGAAGPDPSLDRLSTMPDRPSGAEDRITAGLATLAEAVRGMPGSLRKDVETTLGAIRADLEVVQSLPAHVARALDVVRGAVGEIADSQEGVGRRMEEIEAGLVALRESMGSLAGAIEERMSGVDRLAGAVESLARKRGFKDLVRSEEEAVRQQEEHVARLVTMARELTETMDRVREDVGSVSGSLADRMDRASETLAGRVRGVATSLAERVDQVETTVTGIVQRLRETDLARRNDLSPVLERVGGRLGAALEDLRERLSADLAAGLDRVRAETHAAAPDAEVAEIAAGQKELDEALRVTRAELTRIRKRMDSWGKARSAPRIADELTTLEERVGELERSVQEELTDAVADRMEAHLDRRFEALVQLLESRITALTATEPDDRRGLFRRR